MATLLVILPILAVALLLYPQWGFEFAPLTNLAKRLGMSIDAITNAIGWFFLIVWFLLITYTAYLNLRKVATKRKLILEKEKARELAQKKSNKRDELISEIERLRNDPNIDDQERERLIQRLKAEVDWLLSDDIR
jgi:flagellar biosynthesis/type III secretory pathway M-ring protein FliF/YscJ